MPQTETKSLIVEASTEVLESMCFTGVVGEMAGSSVYGGDCISARLYFSGATSGELGISASLTTATTLAAAFLGEDPSQLTSSQIAEFLGELSNMICGSTLSRMAGNGVYKLSHPTSETCFPSYLPNGTRQTIQLDRGELFIWLSVGDSA